MAFNVKTKNDNFHYIFPREIKFVFDFSSMQNWETCHQISGQFERVTNRIGIIRFIRRRGIHRDKLTPINQSTLVIWYRTSSLFHELTCSSKADQIQIRSDLVMVFVLYTTNHHHLNLRIPNLKSHGYYVAMRIKIHLGNALY